MEQTIWTWQLGWGNWWLNQCDAVKKQSTVLLWRLSLSSSFTLKSTDSTTQLLKTSRHLKTARQHDLWATFILFGRSLLIKASQLSSTGALFLSFQDRNMWQNTHNPRLTSWQLKLLTSDVLSSSTRRNLFSSQQVDVKRFWSWSEWFLKQKDSDVIQSRDAQKQKSSRVQFGSERVNSLSTRLGYPAFSALGCSPCVSMGRADSSAAVTWRDAAADGRGGRTNPGWPAEPQDLFLAQQELKRCSFKPGNRRRLLCCCFVFIQAYVGTATELHVDSCQVLCYHPPLLSIFRLRVCTEGPNTHIPLWDYNAIAKIVLQHRWTGHKAVHVQTTCHRDACCKESRRLCEGVLISPPVFGWSPCRPEGAVVHPHWQQHQPYHLISAPQTVDWKQRWQQPQDLTL